VLAFYVFLPVHLCVFVSVYLAQDLPTFLPTCLPTYLPIYLSIHPSIHPSIRLSACLCVCLYVRMYYIYLFFIIILHAPLLYSNTTCIGGFLHNYIISTKIPCSIHKFVKLIIIVYNFSKGILFVN